MEGMSEGERNYLSRAIRHYSTLFTFPSYPVLVASMFVIVTIIVAAAFLMSSYTLDNLLRGIVFSLGVLMVSTVCADFFTARLFKDPLLNIRRLAALSTVTTIEWALIVAIGAAVQTVTGSLGLVRSTFLGASLIIGFRFLVVRSLSLLGPLESLVVALLPPGLCLAAATFFWSVSPPYLLVLTTAVSGSLLILAGEILLRVLDKHSEESVGTGALRLFHGFVYDWLEGIADPLEEYLEEIAVSTTASTSVMGFVSNAEAQGLIVVPDIHPGPFKNVGSSNIPFEIQEALENRTMAPVMVPHGASGHERDLASKKQSERLVNSIADAVNFTDFSDSATPMIRCASGDAHASCQFFGDVALVTLTCAPKSMEDVPFELGAEIVEKGKALGAQDVIVVDAHNSIGNADEVPILLPEQLLGLKVAAESAIKAAQRLNRSAFRFGSSCIVPKELGLKEGLGPGGIAVVVFEVQHQKMAYVTFDGNNVVKGLREEVRDTLKDIVDDCEVLATDTHIVNAISTIKRGYRPVGEVGSREALLSYVRSCTLDALSRLREARSAYRRVNVPNMLVIGEEKLKSLSILVDSSIALLKRLTVLVYGPSLIFTTLMFLLLP